MPDSQTKDKKTVFRDFDLAKPLFTALDEVGYEVPTPIQAETIPLILEGSDVIGQAQTGTGKTAAFALPLLSMIDLAVMSPQILVLAPTRELAIQVAEAFQRYASHMKGFHVLPVYGGTDYTGQLRQLKRGAQVVVGTPGRVMDHIRRGTLKLDGLKSLVLDEADEMLRMGFIDDVEWILDQTPESRQVVLFSATMPTAIKRIAQKYLRDPKQIHIKVKTSTAETIRQRYLIVNGPRKLDALTRILEVETTEGMIIFVRTKTATVEIAEKLQARGFAATALNGDIPQIKRERTIAQLKSGKVDIVVATDVAARGLDVERISHVINYDIPHDTESYVHRIGRTGRAGRSGDAILFVAPREKRLLLSIEKATRQKVESMELPSAGDVNKKRVDDFKQRITDVIAEGELQFFEKLVAEYETEHGTSTTELAAALAKMAQGKTPLIIKEKEAPTREEWSVKKDRLDQRSPRGQGTEQGMVRYRIEVGKSHQAKPGNIVGAIANEAGVDARSIGKISMFDDYSTVDLPEGMPKEILQHLKKTWVAGQQLRASKVDGDKDFFHMKKKFGGRPAHRGKARAGR